MNSVAQLSDIRFWARAGPVPPGRMWAGSGTEGNRLLFGLLLAKSAAQAAPVVCFSLCLDEGGSTMR